MTTTIQQLEDLKEWSKDSTRYERRLAFRGNMGTEAGTIPIEWDELSDREREYYRTGPWSTREDYRKGQLVQPGPGRQPFAPENVVRVAGPEVYKITGTSSRASPLRDAVLQSYKKFKNTFKNVPSAEEIWKYQSVKKVFGKTSAPLTYIRQILRKAGLPYKFESASSAAVKLKKHLRTLRKGTLLDMGKLMDEFGVNTAGNFQAILKEPEFANKKFKIIYSKRDAYAKSRIGKEDFLRRKYTGPITPAEMKKIESLWSSKYSNKKGTALIKALYADGQGHEVRSLISELKQGQRWGDTRTKSEKLRTAILDAYKKFKKTNNRIPRTKDIYKYKSVQKLLTGFDSPFTAGSYIGRVLKDNKLPYDPSRELKYTSEHEKARAQAERRKLKELKFSDRAIERLTKGKRGFVIPEFKLGPLKLWSEMEIGGIQKHHMNSLRQNVNLRNVAYLSARDNWWLAQRVESPLEKIYTKREELLKKKPKDWKAKVNALNDQGRNILKRVPEKLKGLINFEVVEVNPNGTLKTSNIGMDWRKSIGAQAGEVGKIDFNKLSKIQKKKILALHADAYEAFKANRFKAFTPGAGAAGTLGGLGIGLGAVAAGAEYQQGKPLYDVFANLPLEFASFGMIPATEISQQLRIRGDLKDKGLSFAERNKKMALYNRLQAQEAIEQDVGDVGLESYALSGLGEGETKEQAYAVRGDEDIELMKRKIKRGYNPETGKWEDRDPIAFEEAMLAEGGRIGLEDGKSATADTSMISKLFSPHFPSGAPLDWKDRAKILGTAAIGDVLVNQGQITKAIAKTGWKWLPFAWTPAGDVALHKLFSDKEPKIEDFAEPFEKIGVDINSDAFKKGWNAAPEKERKKLLYDLAGKTMDTRSTSEKIKETAASPWTHVTYAFWKPGVEAMKRALQYDPGNKTLAKKWALRAIRMGIPMKVISAVNPIGWALTGATTYRAIQKEFEGKMRKEPLTESEQMGIQKRKEAVPKMLDTYEQASQIAKEQQISYEDALKQVNKPDIPGLDFKIDYSLPGKFAFGGSVNLTRTVAPDSGPMSQGLRSLYIDDMDY